MTDVLIVQTTVPDAATADRLATALVEERLAACVQVLPGMRSTYRWQGSVERADECLVLAKTSTDRFEALRERLSALHPYELPELVAVEVGLGHEPYLAWVRDGTR